MRRGLEAQQEALLIRAVLDRMAVLRSVRAALALIGCAGAWLAPPLAARSSARLAGADGEWDLRLVYDGNDPICCAEIEKVKRNPELSGRVSFADTTAAGFDTNDPANAGLDFELAEGKIITVHRDKKGECNHFLDEKGVGAFESARHAWFHVDAASPPE